MDFVHDQLATGRKLRVLTIVDTFSRFSPAVILLFPVELGRRADAGPAANIRHGYPVITLLRINAFWASENLEAFIALRSSQPGNHHGKL